MNLFKSLFASVLPMLLCPSLTALAKPWEATVAISPEAMTNTGRNAYFILEPGYQLVLEGKEAGQRTTLTITVLDETKLVNGIQTRVVEEREVADGKPIEVSRNYFTIGAQTGNVYYFGEDVDIYKGGQVGHEGSWLAGINGAQHGIAMPRENKLHDRYYQERAPKVAMDRAETVSVTEQVKTPSGQYEQCLKVKETTPIEAGTEYKWYAPGVGVVKEAGLLLVKHGFIAK